MPRPDSVSSYFQRNQQDVYQQLNFIRANGQASDLKYWFYNPADKAHVELVNFVSSLADDTTIVRAIGQMIADPDFISFVGTMESVEEERLEEILHTRYGEPVIEFALFWLTLHDVI